MKRTVTVITAACFLAMSSVGLAAGPQLPSGQSRLNVVHDPLRCVSATMRPVVDAKVTPQNEMERGYVYFREKGSADFYYVLMTPRPLDVAGELPRPLPGMNGLEYYVQATDVARSPVATGQYSSNLDAVCSDPRSSASTAGLNVGLTRDCQNPVPPGFNKEDIARVILASGAVVSLADAVQAFNACGGAAGAAGKGAAAAATTGTTVGTVALVAGSVALAVGWGFVVSNNTNGVGGAPVSSARPASSRKDSSGRE